MAITHKPKSKTASASASASTATTVTTATTTVTTATTVTTETTATTTDYVPLPSCGPPRTMGECVNRFKHLCAWVAHRLEAQRDAGSFPEHDPDKPWMRPRPSLRRKARYMQQQLILQKFFQEQRILQ